MAYDDLGKVDLTSDIVGTTGLRRVGGYIEEEYLQNLKGQRGMRYYGEMVDNCSVIGAIMFVIDSLVRQVPWRLETQKGQEQNQEALKWRDFSDTLMTDMSHTFEDLISEALSFIQYGYSPFELIYKLRKGDSRDSRFKSRFNDGAWGWRKIEIRSQDTIQRWDFADDNGLAGVWQQDTYAPRHGTVYMPIEKLLLFRTRSFKSNPEGRSLLRSSVRDYHLMKRAQENEAIGIGRDLGGMVVIEVPPEWLIPNVGSEIKYQLDNLKRMAQRIQVDEHMGAVFPSETGPDGKPTGFKLRLLQAAGGQRINTNDIIKRYESRIAMSFLAEFMMIGTEKVGTSSLFQGKSNLFGIGMSMLLNQIANVLNRYAVPRLMTLNNVPQECWPQFTHGDVISPDLDKIGMFLQALGVTGLLSPNDKLESRLLEMAGLPVPDMSESPLVDPTMVTPSEGADQATGLMSERQSETVMTVNEKLTEGKISIEAATALLASVLGMSDDAVKRFITDPAKMPKAEPAPKPEALDPRELKRQAEADDKSE